MNLLICVQLFTTSRIAAHPAPPSMGSSRQEYWSGVPLPSPWYWARILLFFYFKKIIKKRKICLHFLTWKLFFHFSFGQNKFTIVQIQENSLKSCEIQKFILGHHSQNNLLAFYFYRDGFKCFSMGFLVSNKDLDFQAKRNPYIMIFPILTILLLLITGKYWALVLINLD